MGIRIIAGIGNPGTEYAGTRHNLGFEVIRTITERNEVFSAAERFHAQAYYCRIAGEYAVCMKSLLFVNRTGMSVKSALDYYNASLNDVCLISDDVHIASGTIRFKRGGSSGGHRGIASVIDECRSEAFPRLKIGIGREYIADMTSYVLGLYTGEEKKVLDRAVNDAADAVDVWLKQGIEKSMNIYN